MDKLAGLAQSVKSMLGTATSALNPYNFTFTPPKDRFQANDIKQAPLAPFHAAASSILDPRLPLLDRPATDTRSWGLKQIKDDLIGAFYQKPDAAGKVRFGDRTRHAIGRLLVRVPQAELGLRLAGMPFDLNNNLNRMENEVMPEAAANALGQFSADARDQHNIPPHLSNLPTLDKDMERVRQAVRSRAGRLGKQEQAGVMALWEGAKDYKWPLPPGVRETGIPQMLSDRLLGPRNKDLVSQISGDAAQEAVDAWRENYGKNYASRTIPQAASWLRTLTPQGWLSNWATSNLAKPVPANAAEGSWGRPGAKIKERIKQRIDQYTKDVQDPATKDYSNIPSPAILNPLQEILPEDVVKPFLPSIEWKLMHKQYPKWEDKFVAKNTTAPAPKTEDKPVVENKPDKAKDLVPDIRAALGIGVGGGLAVGGLSSLMQPAPKPKKKRKPANGK